MDALLRPLHRARRRLRALRAGRALLVATTRAAVIAAPVVLVIRHGWAPPDAVLPTLVIAAAWILVSVARAATRTIDPIALASSLDRTAGAGEQYANAIEILGLPSAQVTDYMRAHVARVAARPPALNPAAAVPFGWPGNLPLALAAIAALAAALHYAPPRPAWAPWEPPPIPPPDRIVDGGLALERERVEALRAVAEQLDDDELRQIAAELTRILDRMEAGDDTRELFAELEALRKRIDASGLADLAALQDALKNAARTLRATPALEAVARATAAGDLDAAADALDRLQQRRDDGRLDDREADRIARALEQTADGLDPLDRDLRRALDADARRRDEAAAARKNDPPDDALETRRRETLEKTPGGAQRDRASQAFREAARQLRRTPTRPNARGGDPGGNAQAGGARSGEQPGGAERGESTGGPQAADASAGRSATDRLRDLSREKRAGEARQEADRRTRSVRETAQRRGNSGGDASGRDQDMRDYLDRARGGAGGRNDQPSGGDSGSGGQGGRAGDRGTGAADGAGGSPGDAPRGSERPGPRQLERSGNDTAGGQGQGRGAGSGRPGGGQGGGQPGGSGAGRGHIDNQLDDPTELDGTRVAVRASADDSGQGASTAEIIAGATDDGFASTPYRRVFQEYEGVVEEVMERDRVPSGYRFYIRRYFDLISPRDTP